MLQGARDLTPSYLRKVVASDFARTLLNSISLTRLLRPWVHRAPGSEKIVLPERFVSGSTGSAMQTWRSLDLFGFEWVDGRQVVAGLHWVGDRVAVGAEHSNAVLSWPDRLTSHMRSRWIASAN